MKTKIRRGAVSFLAGSAIVLAGCSGGPNGPTLDERLDGVEGARAQLQAPAVSLGEAVAQLDVRIGQLAAHPGQIEREATTDAIDEVAAAVDLVDSVVLESTSPSGFDLDEVITAAAAVDVAVDVGRELILDAEAVVSVVDELIVVDDELTEITEAWHEAGSRRQQMERFGELATQAEDLAQRIEAIMDDGGLCRDLFDLRVELAQGQVETGLELRDMVDRYQGLAFDERRAELRDDPFGLGSGVELPVPIVATDCAELAGVEDGVAAVMDQLSALQKALNPDDLAA